MKDKIDYRIDFADAMMAFVLSEDIPEDEWHELTVTFRHLNGGMWYDDFKIVKR